jgi:hypothetical protein
VKARWRGDERWFEIWIAGWNFDFSSGLTPVFYYLWVDALVSLIILCPLHGIVGCRIDQGENSGEKRGGNT